MQAYRQKATSLAVQYTGEPIAGVTCDGSSSDPTISQAARQLNGCDPSRAHLPHVHTAQVGGLGIVTPGCWIMPVRGGPFCVVEDAQFRAHFEVPEVVAAALPVEPYVDEVSADEPVAAEPADNPLPAVDPTEDPAPPAPADEPTDTVTATDEPVLPEPASEVEPSTEVASAANELAAPAEEAAPPKRARATKKARQ